MNSWEPSSKRVASKVNGSQVQTKCTL